MTTPDTRPPKPTPDFPLFAHGNGQWAKKANGKLRYFGPWANPEAALAKYLGGSGHEQAMVTRKEKRGKPHPDYPLYLHASGQWAKRIRGKVHYFGTDPQVALEDYNTKKDALLAGREPAPATEGVTVGYLASHFLRFKEGAVATGEICQRTWTDYKAVCDRVVAFLGKDRPLVDLRPDDFAALRQHFANGHGLVTLWNDITRTRVLFQHATGSLLIDRPVAYGKGFEKPDKTKLRGARQAKGPRMFKPEDIRKMLDSAKPQLKAMILLGVNCGFGNTDCATVPQQALDLDGGWVDFPRPKTKTRRRGALWPETIQALKESLDARPEPKDPALANRVFVTKYAHGWDTRAKSGIDKKVSRDDPIAKETGKLLRALGLHKPGLGFYTLRHVFQTVGQKTRDKDAVREIMGHAPHASDMSAVCNEEPVDDARLRAVANHVHNWLFPPAFTPVPVATAETPVSTTP
jgi:integrase